MRHFIKKLRDFITRLFEINQYLAWFLPLNTNQKLPTSYSELLDIAWFAIPTTWQNTMCLHAFDLLPYNKDEIIEFCQQCKFIEWPLPHQQQLESNDNGNRHAWLRDHPQDHNMNQKCAAKCKTSKDDDNNGKPKWCEYHQNSTHKTGTCWDVLAQVAAMHQPIGAIMTGPLRSVRSLSIQQLHSNPRLCPKRLLAKNIIESSC